MDPTDRATGFLRSCGMFHGEIDAARCTREFIEEMEAGLAGRASSLRMIPTFIEADGEIPMREDEVFGAGIVHVLQALLEQGHAFALRGNARDVLGLLADQLECAMQHACAIEPKMRNLKTRQDFRDRIDIVERLLDVARLKILQL